MNKDKILYGDKKLKENILKSNIHGSEVGEPVKREVYFGNGGK